MGKVFENPILVTKSFLPPYEEYCDQIRKIWESHWLTNHGPLHKSLEEGIKNYLDVQSVSFYTNGHLGLEGALDVLNLKGEVITTPFTFVSTTHAIINRGLDPVFCDINMTDYTIDVEKIERLITPKTSAILAVHVFGNPCDVEKLEEIAKRHNLKLIYDAAHVFGVQWKGKGIGTFGDISMFSLHATKVFHTIEGGLLTFKDPELAPKLHLYQNFGIAGPETIKSPGINAKMNEFQAAMGLVNLNYINEQISLRKNVYDRYLEKLKGIPGIKLLCPRKETTTPNYSYFPIVVDESKYGLSRDQLDEVLKTHNIFARKYFYPLTTDVQSFNGKYDKAEIPTARYISDRVLTLPMYAALTHSEIDGISEIIREYHKSVEVI